MKNQQQNNAWEQKKKPCRYHIKGRCKFGNQCRLSHQIIKCYLIRHAQSSFNQVLQAFEHASNSNEAKEKFQMDESLIDCGITQKGISQIDNIDFPQDLKTRKMKFDLIFVSPLNRCLKTAERCMKKHKMQAKKVIVLPGLTEVMSKICDFSLSVEQKVSRFPQFDFSFMQSGSKQEWQDMLVDPEFQQKVNKQQNFAKRYIKILHQVFPQPLESSQRCFRRTLQTVQQIVEICEKEKADKIVIFSHNRIIKYIMGRNRNGKSQSIENCQINFTVLQKKSQNHQ